MVSYWKDHRDIYHDGDAFTVIIGTYDHQNSGHPFKSLGVHWGTYPNSRGILSPCVIPKDARDALLSGLLHKAVVDGDTETIKNITEAIDFFKS